MKVGTPYTRAGLGRRDLGSYHKPPPPPTRRRITRRRGPKKLGYEPTSTWDGMTRPKKMAAGLGGLAILGGLGGLLGGLLGKKGRKRSKSKRKPTQQGGWSALPTPYNKFVAAEGKRKAAEWKKAFGW